MKWLKIFCVGMALPACVYEAQTIAPCSTHAGLGPCGPGERCEARDGVEVCACGSSYATGGPACGADQICHPELHCNTPPVAWIGDGSSQVNVASAAAVYFDGSSSYDPDPNEVIDFNWTINGDGVDGTPFGDEPVLRLMAGRLNQGDVLALTVRDLAGDENTASVTVSVVDVGAHVSAALPCTSDNSVLAGEPGNPWCSVSLGIAAALAYHIDEIRVDEGTYVEDVVVPPIVSVVGGYRRAGNWQRFADAVSDLQVMDNDGMVFLPTRTGPRLVDIKVSRAMVCTGPCALITAAGASFRLEGCHVDNRFLINGWATRAIHVSGPARVELARSPAGRPTTIEMAQDAADNYGIFLDGINDVVTGTLDSPQITLGTDVAGADREIAGIRLLATQDVVITTPNVTMSMYNGSGDRAFGILDGTGSAFAPAACGSPACFGSWNLALSPGFVTVQINGKIAAAVALMGSMSARVISTVPGVALRGSWSELSVGLWSVQTDDLALTGLGGNALELSGAAATPGGEASLGVGFLDGAPMLDFAASPPITLAGGSSGLTVERVSATGAQVSSTSPVSTVAGMILAGTAGATISDISLSCSTSVPSEVSVGLWSLGTEDVTVTRMFVLPDNVQALTLAAGVVDGLYAPGQGGLLYGSRWLSITNSSIDSQLQGAAGQADPVAACVILAGSRETWIGMTPAGARAGNHIHCVTYGPGALYQILTLGTQDVWIVANNAGDPNESATSPQPYGRLYAGIQDGAGQGGLESYGLTIDGNLLFAPLAPWYQHQVGILIDHTGAANSGDGVLITNNVVFGAAAQTSTALWLKDTPALVFNNTLHGGDCVISGAPGCQLPVTTAGINVATGLGDEVKLAGNLIFAGAGAEGRYVIIDQGATLDGTTNVAAGATLGVAVFHKNALADTSNSLTGYTAYLYSGGDGQVPPTGGYSYDGTNIAGLLANLAAMDPLFESMRIDTPALCPDRHHLDPTADGLVNAGSTDYYAVADLDGEPRSDPTPDVGADEVWRNGCP